MLRFNFEHTNLIGFVEGLPQTEIARVQTRVLVPDGGTILLGGQKITSEKKDGRKVLKKLLVLVKAEKHKPQKPQP